MSGNVIWDDRYLIYCILSHFDTICREPVNMQVIRLRGRETAHFSVNLQQKGEDGSALHSSKLFSLIQFHLSIPYNMQEVVGSLHYITDR